MKTPITKIIVKAKSERGRWRAGLHFTREAVELDVAELGDDKVEAISTDPELVVAFVAEPAAHKKGKTDERSPEQIKADDEALAREKAATKNKAGKEAWAKAEAAAREARGSTEGEWTNLADSDRVARIEAVIAEGAK